MVLEVGQSKSMVLSSAQHPMNASYCIVTGWRTAHDKTGARVLDQVFFLFLTKLLMVTGCGIHHTCNPSYLDSRERFGGSWFKGSPGKKLAKSQQQISWT
jgi:hypothetical protein